MDPVILFRRYRIRLQQKAQPVLCAIDDQDVRHEFGILHNQYAGLVVLSKSLSPGAPAGQRPPQQHSGTNKPD
jgi:hypothetical protein